MKRTNIVVDEKIVSECKRLTGIETTRGVVDRALREMARRGRQRKLLDLWGKVDWEGDLSKMRRGRFGT